MVFGIGGRELRQRVAVMAQQQRVDMLWQEIADRWGTLTVEQVAAATGLGAREADIVTANVWPRHGLLGAKRDGQLVFPAWQIATHGHRGSTGGVDPHWVSLQAPLIAAGWSPEEILLWAASPSGRLAGSARPADFLGDDPSSAIQAAIEAAHGASG